VAERCRFAGKRPPDELPAFLALSAVVVSPRSAGEYTPFKIYTYLAAGWPRGATRIPPHTQLLDVALATLGDPAAAAQRAGRGVALIEREYSAERYAEKVAAAYAHVAAVAGRG
jgi:hypothetical protein